MILRPYQQEAIAALWEHWRAEPNSTPLIVCPTGAGKSLICAEIVRKILLAAPKMHILILSHRKEIIRQNADEIHNLLKIPVGVYSAGLGSKIIRQVTCANIQSVFKKPFPPQGLVIVDECFTGDTLISTPGGQQRIDLMRCGDYAYNALGVGQIQAISAKKAKSILRIKFSDGTEIRCTRNHPFFTASGWKQADRMALGEIAFSKEDLLALWQGNEALEKGEPKARANSSIRKKLGKNQILLNILLKEAREPYEGSSCSQENERDIKTDRSSAYSSWRERAIVTLTAACSTSRAWRGLASGVYCNNKDGRKKRNLSKSLQNRHCEQRENDRDRAGRGISLLDGKKGTGCSQDSFPNCPRVVDISSVESEGDTIVYNLQLSGHPSFFANDKLVHNCHMISESSDSMYRKFLDAQPQTKVVGLTATPYRMDRGSLVGDLFTGIAYDIPLKQLIEQGYLAPLVSRPTGKPIDFSRVRKSGNDYNQEALEQTMLPHTREHCESIVQNAADRNKILVFCSGIKHAKECAEILPNADYITGEMDPITRDRKIRDFKSGTTRILCNVDVLTTGFNVPSVDCVVLLRATQSVGLYVQIVGRGSRLAPSKTNCLVLDYGKNIQTHGPIDLIEVRHRKHEKDPQFSIPPVKACDHCGAVVSIRAVRCPGCGEDFPPASCKLETHPETASILSEPEPAHPVRSTEYKIHIKDGKPPMLRIRYWTGTTAYYDMYLCFEHAGYAQQKAIQIWKKLGGNSPPATSGDAYYRAMRGEIGTPEQIRVKKRGKYHDITHFINLKKHEAKSWQETENLYI